MSNANQDLIDAGYRKLKGTGVIGNVYVLPVPPAPFSALDLDITEKPVDKDALHEAWIRGFANGSDYQRGASSETFDEWYAHEYPSPKE